MPANPAGRLVGGIPDPRYSLGASFGILSVPAAVEIATEVSGLSDACAAETAGIAWSAAGEVVRPPAPTAAISLMSLLVSSVRIVSEMTGPAALGSPARVSCVIEPVASTSR